MTWRLRGFNVETSPGMLLMQSCARHLFLPCLGIEVLPNQDIAAAPKGLTSEGKKEREISRVYVRCHCCFSSVWVLVCSFLFWRLKFQQKSWEQHLKYLEILEPHFMRPNTKPFQGSPLPARISRKMRWWERWKMIWWRCHRYHSNTHVC